MTCSWAACHTPADGIADDWPMCTPHLELAVKLKYEDLLASGDLDALIRKMHRQGRTDKQMAAALGITPWQVRYRRRVMGLSSARPAAADCGTRSGYERHRERGETVCAECRQARRVYDQERYARQGRRAA